MPEPSTCKSPGARWRVWRGSRMTAPCRNRVFIHGSELPEGVGAARADVAVGIVIHAVAQNAHGTIIERYARELAASHALEQRIQSLNAHTGIIVIGERSKNDALHVRR